MNEKIIKCVVLVCLFISFVFVSYIDAVTSSTIFYYNPDSNIQNYILLVKKMSQLYQKYA